MVPIEFGSTPLFSDPNLVAYYKLENTSDGKGSRTLTNHGTVPFNAAEFNNGADGGSVGQTTKWLDYTSDNYGLNGGAISFGCWIKMGLEVPNGQVYVLVSHGDSGNHVTEDIIYDNTGGTPTIIARRIKNGVTIDSVSATITLGTSVFHHIFLTYDGATLSLYIDGVLSGTPVAASGNGSLGGVTGLGILDSAGGPSTNKTTGIIDDVPILSRGLTAAEILQLFSGSSPSASLSPSASKSPSASQSPSSSSSSSASLSVSPSASKSPSSSQSPSSSSSHSVSPSSSASASASPSPSVGYSSHSRGNYVSLPTNTNDLETLYTPDEETHVSKRDDLGVGQAASGQYAIHQFKILIGTTPFVQVEWEGHSDLAPMDAPVYLQIYNTSTNLWETVDSNGDADENIDFELEKKLRDPTNYKDINSILTARVYQLSI